MEEAQRAPQRMRKPVLNFPGSAMHHVYDAGFNHLKMSTGPIWLLFPEGARHCRNLGDEVARNASKDPIMMQKSKIKSTISVDVKRGRWRPGFATENVRQTHSPVKQSSFTSCFLIDLKRERGRSLPPEDKAFPGVPLRALAAAFKLGM